MSNKSIQKHPEKRLSHRINEYCKKYARNRDLEKYLRPCSGSSNDSVQKLMTLTSFTQEEKENLCLDNNENNEMVKPNLPLVNDSRYNFVVEKRIEITSTKDSTQNQSLSIEVSAEFQMAAQENELSPANTSQAKLEWDALADIGYNSKGSILKVSKKTENSPIVSKKMIDQSTQHIDKTLASFCNFTANVHSTPTEKPLPGKELEAKSAENVCDQEIDNENVKTDSLASKDNSKSSKGYIKKSFSLEEIVVCSTDNNLKARSNSEDLSGNDKRKRKPLIVPQEVPITCEQKQNHIENPIEDAKESKDDTNLEVVEEHSKTESPNNEDQSSKSKMNSKSQDQSEKSSQSSSQQSSATVHSTHTDNLVESASTKNSESASFEFIPGKVLKKESRKKALLKSSIKSPKENQTEVDEFTLHLSASINNFLKPDRQNFSRIEEGTKILKAIANNKSMDTRTKKSLFNKILKRMINDLSLDDSGSDLGVRPMSSSSKGTSFHLDSIATEKGAEKASSQEEKSSRSRPKTEIEKRQKNNSPVRSQKSEKASSPEWLEPMTISEKMYDAQMKQKLRDAVVPTATNQPSTSHRKNSPTYQWIYQTIKHLNQLVTVLTEKIESPTHPTSLYSSPQDDEVSWSSHKNVAKPRNKLQTPINETQNTKIESASESLDSYAKRREKHFTEKYYSQARDGLSYLPNNSSTTTTSSSQFLSSKSMTVSFANSSYRSKKDAAIQTSASVEAVDRISKEQNSHRSTIRVKKLQKNVQIQSNPQPIAYLLEFPKKPSNRNLETNNPKVKNVCDLEVSRCLPKNILKEAEKRRHILREINEERKIRAAKRIELMEIKSNESLKVNLEKMAPQLVQKRLFNSKRVRAQSRERAKTLPEYLHKKRTEKLNHVKKSTRMLTKQFNQNVQQQVLRGKLNFSYSVQNVM